MGTASVAAHAAWAPLPSARSWRRCGGLVGPNGRAVPSFGGREDSATPSPPKKTMTMTPHPHPPCGSENESHGITQEREAGTPHDHPGRIEAREREAEEGRRTKSQPTWSTREVDEPRFPSSSNGTLQKTVAQWDGTTPPQDPRRKGTWTRGERGEAIGEREEWMVRPTPKKEASTDASTRMGQWGNGSETTRTTTRRSVSRASPWGGSFREKKVSPQESSEPQNHNSPIKK